VRVVGRAVDVHKALALRLGPAALAADGCRVDAPRAHRRGRERRRALLLLLLLLLLRLLLLLG
jgi:hypothetical protein